MLNYAPFPKYSIITAKKPPKMFHVKQAIILSQSYKNSQTSGILGAFAQPQSNGNTYERRR